MRPADQYVVNALPGLPEDSANGVLVVSPRGRILDAMTASVAERGYAATSIAEVIQRARASRSTFYEQFTDKEDCYLAAYQLTSDYYAARVIDAAQNQWASPREYLALLYDAYLTELARYPLVARAFLIEIRAAGAPSQQHHRNVQDRFAELLRIPGADDEPLARTAVIALSDEIINREITDHGTEGLATLGPKLVDLAARILTPNPATNPGQPRPARNPAKPKSPR